MGIYKKETGFSREYQSEWDLNFAIREIIQNHVYALQVFQVEGNHSWYNGIATFSDRGNGIAKKFFLNGNSGQRQIENSPGQFGEGMKLAFLIFAREGKLCKVDTVGYSMEAIFEYNQQMETEELFFNFSDNDRTNGTTFEIECSQAEYLEAIEFFGFLSGNKERFLTSNFWKINDNQQELFVNGVKLNNSNIRMLFSYNIIGKDINNRDRNAVDNYKINREIWKQIIPTTTNKEYIRAILENYENGNYVEYYYTYPNRIENIDLWKEIAQSIWGKKVVYSSGSNKTDTQAEYRRFKVIPKPSSDTVELLEIVGIVSASTVITKIDKTHNNIQLKDLTQLEKDNIKEARKLIQKHYTDVGNLRYIQDLTDKNDCKLNGLYSPEEDLIYLERDILSDYDQLFQTLLHETIHKVSGAKDCTEEFQNEATKAALKFALGCTREKRK